MRRCGACRARWQRFGAKGACNMGMMSIALLAATLVPGVEVGGRWLDAAAAAKEGLVVSERVADGVRRVTLENRSGRSVFPSELGWRKSEPWRDGFVDSAGLKVYVESWQMASPCGVRTAEDLPFDYSPDYLHNCVSTPGDFHPGERGAFLSDNMCAFRRLDGRTRLYGFTTSADRFGHFRIKLSKNGLDDFAALCSCDGAELKDGATIESESLVTLEGDDGEGLFAMFADRWARDMSARHVFTEAPVGWCSWYYFFEKVTLEDVLGNVDWFAANRAAGFEKVRIIQLDDGYQSALGDWLLPNEKFPGGLAAFAQEVKARGFVPAAWVGPFMAEENSRIFAEHPEWMVRGADGRPASPFTWRGGHRVHVLDATNPEVQEHLTRLFREIRKMGIDYVKLDFCMLECSVARAKYHDPSATRAQALRRGLEAIRRGFGDDGFILVCTTPFGPSVGIADAMRSSTDITPYWAPEGKWHAEAPTVPNVVRNVINHNYMNGRLWINDPDTLIVRDNATKLTEGEVRLWADAISFAGGSLLLSDNFPLLSPARLQLARRVLAEAGSCLGTYPEDRWERAIPAVWKSVRDGRRATLLLNASDEAAVVEGQALPPRSSLCVGASGEWVVEAGVRKFKVGRPSAAAAAESKAAYARTADDTNVVRVEPGTTLDEVNAMEIPPGTKVLFRRGGVWRGQLLPRSGKPGHPVVYGAFGEGPKPVIQPSWDRSRRQDWRREDNGMWCAVTHAAADIGNIVFDHGAKGCAFKRGKLEECRRDLDFWCDPKTFEVHMRSWTNPAARFSSVELCEKVHCIDESGMHDVVYDSLALRYSAAHGIGGTGVKRIVIRNCDISWIGGGYLYFDNFGNGVRYGNGIEFWSEAEDVTVEGNRVWECWDAGLTNQSSGDGVAQRNIFWRSNEVWNCEYSYEYWQQGEGAVTENVQIEGNRFRDAGRGWGHHQRWNPNAAHLMFYDTTAETKGFVVRNNVFSRSENTLFRFFNDWRESLTFVGNLWIAEDESLCRFHGRPTAKLIYKYPDRLDQVHDDNLAEIESQTVTAPRIFRSNEIKAFKEFIHE